MDKKHVVIEIGPNLASFLTILVICATIALVLVFGVH